MSVARHFGIFRKSWASFFFEVLGGQNDCWRPVWVILGLVMDMGALGGGVNSGGALMFLGQNQLKTCMFRHRFLEAFPDDIFYGFERLLDLVLEIL